MSPIKVNSVNNNQAGQGQDGPNDSHELGPLVGPKLQTAWNPSIRASVPCQTAAQKGQLASALGTLVLKVWYQQTTV